MTFHIPSPFGIYARSKYVYTIILYKCFYTPCEIITECLGTPNALDKIDETIKARDDAQNSKNTEQDTAIANNDIMAIISSVDSTNNLKIELTKGDGSKISGTVELPDGAIYPTCIVNKSLIATLSVAYTNENTTRTIYYGTISRGSIALLGDLIIADIRDDGSRITDVSHASETVYNYPNRINSTNIQDDICVFNQPGTYSVEIYPVWGGPSAGIITKAHAIFTVSESLEISVSLDGSFTGSTGIHQRKNATASSTISLYAKWDTLTRTG